MKKILGLAAVGFAAAVSAQALPGSVELGGGIGRFYGGSFAKGTTRAFSGKVAVDDDILIGYWAGVQISPQWSAELAVRRSRENLIVSQSGVFPDEPSVGTMDFGTIEILGIRGFPYGNFVPYAGLGFGITNLDPNLPDRSVRDVNRFGLSLALGGKFYAARWFGFRIDARGRATYLGKRRVEDGGWSDTRRWFRNEEILGGLFLAFGGKPGR